MLGDAMTRARLSLLTALLAPAIAVGCAASGASNGGQFPGTGGSINPGTGGSSGGCLTDVCAPPLTTPVSWAVEVEPPSSSTYALTQFTGRDVSAQSPFVALTADTINVTFMAPGSIPVTANVLLTVPPKVPGRPDIVYQAAAFSAGSIATATLSVTQDARASAATLSLVPLPPSDQQTPPYPFSVNMASNLIVTLPDTDVLISGQLLNALQNAPPAVFVARAFQNGVQVSNAPVTQADGTFQLRVPAAAAANPVTLELLPPSADPRVLSTAFTITAGKSLGTITLPAYTKANAFNVMVSNGVTGIAGIAVRAQVNLGPTGGSGTVAATAQYSAGATTDSSGTAALQLLAGSNDQPVTYAITATPPAGSKYASTCIPAVATLSSGSTTNSGTAPTLQTIVPGFRPVLSGRVRTATGVPLSNVSITASGTPDRVGGCPAPAATSASATTDATGSYSLPMDPGTYQLDIDPPVGSVAPRLTEVGVTVPDEGLVTHDVTLPAGVLVKGLVIGDGGEPVASAAVRVFQPRCTGPSDCSGPGRIAPLLRGKALTDAQGQFRIVVADPAGNP